MTREQAQQLDANPVWQGFREGKQVEYRCISGEWRIIGNIGAFDIVTEPDRYRLKPEPRRFWINRYPGMLTAHASQDRAAICAGNDCVECIEVVEVLPQPASQPPAEQPQPARIAREWYDVLGENNALLARFDYKTDAWRFQASREFSEVVHVREVLPSSKGGSQ